MEITLHAVSIRELVEGFENNDEQGARGTSPLVCDLL